MAGAKNHPFHIVDPSPWPAVGALGALVLAIGAVFYMHQPADEKTLWYIIPGFSLVLLTMAGWWRDVVTESHRGHHTAEVSHGLRQGMLLFIISEVMFFFAFFWAFFHASLGFNVTLDAWPPEGIQTFDPWHLPLINTLILLTSGATLTWAHHALMQGNDRRKLQQGLVATWVLGVVFLAFQAFEYSHSAFGFRDGIYPSVFYIATGFHGFHVFVGTVFLMVCSYRVAMGHFNESKHIGFEAAAWYWHFVDVVWLFLFVWIYVWGG